MRLNTQQGLHDEVFELCYHVFVVDIVLLVGGLQHLKVPLRGVLIKLLLVFIVESINSIFIVFEKVLHSELVRIFYEVGILLIDREVR